MGQKVNPNGFRLGIFRDWDARWFARRSSYAKNLIEDLKVRKFLEKSLDRADVSRIEIEKAGDSVRIILHSGKPGMIIGKKGQEIESLRSQIAKIIGKQNIDISVQEIRNPEVDATLVAKNIANRLERRASYKRVMKQAAQSALAGKKSKALGIKICCAGRLAGAEIAREEWAREGSVPLHTLRSDIDYGFAEAKTTYGIIGVKVWIYKGEYQHA